MLNSQSNNSFSSHEFKSKVDVNDCKVLQEGNTVCNFNEYVDTLLYDNFNFSVYPDSYDVSVMLQQAVPCLGWRDWLTGTSPQAHLMSTNLGGALKNTNTDSNKKLSQLEYDGSSFGSVRPAFRNNVANTVSHQINCDMDGAGTSLCRVDFTQHQFYSGTNYLYLVFISNQGHGNHNWAFLEQVNDTQRFKIYTCTNVPSGPIQITDSRFMYAGCHGSDAPYAGGHTDPNIVYQNFKQDCHCFKLHGIMYEQYIVSIIDKMIDQLDCAENNVLKSADTKTLDAVNTNSEDQPNTLVGLTVCL